MAVLCIDKIMYITFSDSVMSSRERKKEEKKRTRQQPNEKVKHIYNSLILRYCNYFFMLLVLFSFLIIFS